MFYIATFIVEKESWGGGVLKQTNVRIRDDSKKKLKLLAVEKGVTLQALIQEAIDNYLKGREKHG